ncbi:hypothetical protein COCSADRAFT_337061 [Bipolaris sorokiniana ND90Pr]|uniref:Uncharacterized protein n=1 Tax=Cochliobolus sativus (strain ND90Pr / ATCC 201652) TaxID=665912 RepID=M2T1H6_COCSN|nr:uncharacterized protein COCSADRAFT_337061 [Bipolaris sorokiniana ND90Pr]EMD63051.1 hypothetical protein COCSADRAFT_337061 [Bipolaris sorokiniana ND90Pr]
MEKVSAGNLPYGTLAGITATQIAFFSPLTQFSSGGGYSSRKTSKLERIWVVMFPRQCVWTEQSALCFDTLSGVASSRRSCLEGTGRGVGYSQARYDLISSSFRTGLQRV